MNIDYFTLKNSLKEAALEYFVKLVQKLNPVYLKY